MQYLFPGSNNLGLDGVILLFAAVGKFALVLVFGLGDRLLGGIEQDFLNLRIGCQKFLKRRDPPPLLAHRQLGSGRFLCALLSQMPQRRIPQGERQHRRQDRQQALVEFATDVALIYVEQVGQQVLSDVETQIHQSQEQAFGQGEREASSGSGLALTLRPLPGLVQRGLVGRSELSQQVIELKNGQTGKGLEVTRIAPQFGNGNHAPSLPYYAYGLKT
jgi:hypothetical protein